MVHLVKPARDATAVRQITPLKSVKWCRASYRSVVEVVDG